MAQSQLDDYFRQVFEESILDLPVHKQSLTSNAMRFLDKRQEIDAVDASLQSKRNEFKVACEQIRQRRDKLSNNEGKAKEALFKFDKFITENDAKRSRGKKKADLQKVMVAQKEQELDDLKREYRTLLSRREKLSCRVTKSTVYHAFLTKLTHMSKKFEDIAQVIARFDTLLATRDQLLEQGTRADSQAERQHVELRRYVSHQSSLLLQLNNALSKLQTELDAVFSRGGKLEYAWNSIQSTAARETLMLGQVKFGILNLFHTAVQRLEMTMMCH
ncbi:coiled-coil domain-containing protein 42 homolog [Engraulis encrasicolus]|uniref:coiled-coil domain-containing protein 42 homolog n=1 Tax=Engraulis encrasicolus TaxID=184585 RepID=UPI002FD0D140